MHLPPFLSVFLNNGVRPEEWYMVLQLFVSGSSVHSLTTPTTPTGFPWYSKWVFMAPRGPSLLIYWTPWHLVQQPHKKRFYPWQSLWLMTGHQQNQRPDFHQLCFVLLCILIVGRESFHSWCFFHQHVKKIIIILLSVTHWCQRSHCCRLNLQQIRWHLLIHLPVLWRSS